MSKRNTFRGYETVVHVPSTTASPVTIYNQECPEGGASCPAASVGPKPNEILHFGYKVTQSMIPGKRPLSVSIFFEYENEPIYERTVESPILNGDLQAELARRNLPKIDAVKAEITTRRDIRTKRKIIVDCIDDLASTLESWSPQ
tara:strand:+ start:9976 stop:10410 length:435 start_codon:yes stop_codon:yes gene_type:complete